MEHERKWETKTKTRIAELKLMPSNRTAEEALQIWESCDKVFDFMLVIKYEPASVAVR